MHRNVDKQDFKNLASLIAIQASNAALPLLIFPYVLKTVGAEYYSKIVTTEAIAILILTFVLYSFEIDGVAKVVSHRIAGEFEQITKLFSQVFYLRLALLGICASLLFLASAWIGSEYLILLTGWMMLPLAYVFQSTWMFQGLERNFPVAVLTVLSRMSAIIAVLLFVQTPSDYYLTPSIIGFAYLIGGITSTAYLWMQMNIRFCRVSFDEVRQLLGGGKEIFFGNLSVILSRDINVLILGALGSKEVVIATYSIAEKLIKGIQAATRPLNQVYFPKALRSLGSEKTANKQVLRKLMSLTYPQLVALIIISTVLTVSYLALNDRIAALASFTHKNEIISMLATMYVAVFIGVANFMLGSVGLNWLGKKVEYFKYILAIGVANLIICPVLVIMLGGIGAAIAFSASQGLLLILVLNEYIHPK